MFSIFLIVWADLFNLPCWCQMWSGWDQIQRRNDSLSRKLPPQARHLKYHRVLLWRQHWLSPYSPLLGKKKEAVWCASFANLCYSRCLWTPFLIWTSWTQEPRDGFSPWGEWDQPQTWSREFGFWQDARSWAVVSYLLIWPAAKV